MKGIAVIFTALVVGLIVASGCVSTPTNPVTVPATTRAPAAEERSVLDRTA